MRTLSALTLALSLALQSPAAATQDPVSAFSPSLELARLARGDGMPVVVLVCSPLGRVVDLLATGGGAQAALADAARKDPDQQFWIDLMSSSGLTAAGFDPAGAVSLNMREKTGGRSGSFAFPFTGGAAQVEALFAHLPKLNAMRDGDGWKFGEEGSGNQARLEGGRLLVTADKTGEPKRFSPLPAGLYDDLPGGNGCAVLFDARLLDGKEGKNPFTGLSLFVPMGEPGVLLARVSPVKTETPPLDRSKGRPIMGASSIRPLAVATVSIPPLELLMHTTSGQKALKPEHVRKINRHLRFRPGMSIAIFAQLSDIFGGEPKRGDFVAGLPVRRPSGLPMGAKPLTRRVAEALKAAEVPATQTGPTSIEIQLGQKPIYLEATRNALWMGTRLELVREAVQGNGRPWADEGHLERAGRWPVAVTVRLPVAGTEGLPINAGMRTRQGLYEIGLEIDDPAVGTLLIGMAGAKVIPDFLAFELKAKRSEVPLTVDSIAIAQDAYFAENDRYIALPPAPRAPDALDREKVAWEKSGDWQAMWISPDPVRGSYWVELSPDGSSYEVHGMADMDGDGVPCHFVRKQGGETQMVTGASIY